MLSTFIRRLEKLIYLLRKYYLEEQRLLRKDNGTRLILLDTPEHTNIGDAAIAVAEKRFLKKYFPLKKIYEFPFDYCRFFFLNTLKRQVREKDVLLIQGGGFIGTLWNKEEIVFERILKAFSQNNIVIFPQTAFFENNQSIDELVSVLKQHTGKIHFFLRDRASFDFMTEHFDVDNVSYYLVPDIVTFISTDNKKKSEMEDSEKKTVLFCMRKDKEMTIDSLEISRIKSLIRKFGYVVMSTDTMANENIRSEDRNVVVNEKLDMFSKSSLVITDRLHGMLFAAITSTPCISFDNISRKVSGQYLWLQYLNYIVNCSPDAVNKELIEKMISTNNVVYDNSILEKYYEKIVGAITKSLSE